MKFQINQKMQMAMLASVFVLAACAPSATPTSAPATSVPVTSSPIVAAPKPAAQASPLAQPTAAPAAAPAATVAPAAVAGTLKIDSAQSSASFTLDEKLLGQPKTVIGKTSKVTGDITLNLANPSQSKVGTIKIDASDLTTDSNDRNGSIRRFILQTNQAENQFITFEPTAIQGLPAAVKVGDTVNFKITGNLKIRAITKPVTFDTTATVKSANEIMGSAKAKVTRTMFELTIPTVRSVADVTDEVALQLDFVAK